MKEGADQKGKLTFTARGAWLGLLAYIVLILIVVIILI